MIEVGMTYTAEKTVTPDMTAKAIGSGGLEVFALLNPNICSNILYIFFMLSSRVIFYIEFCRIPCRE